MIPYDVLVLFTRLLGFIGVGKAIAAKVKPGHRNFHTNIITNHSRMLTA